jgi:site-specific DNA-adenine methylase
VFYYYGRKWKMGEMYPAPTFSTVVEPFAGSAAYSDRHIATLDKVILCDLDDVVMNLWRQMLDPHLTIDDMVPPILKGEVTTNQFHILAAASGGGRYHRLKATDFVVANVAVLRAKLARRLALWRSVEVELIHGSYTQTPSIEATWFVDPPYQGHAGSLYVHGSAHIDYNALARWVGTREGQTVVCEGQGATWLPFEPVASLVGVAGKASNEMVYLSGRPADHGRLL